LPKSYFDSSRENEQIGVVIEQEVVTDLDSFAHVLVGVFSSRRIWDR